MDSAQRIVDDLLSLEIDIILKPGMTARKIPEPPNALLDIIGWYDTCLHQAAKRLNEVWETQEGPPIEVRPSIEGDAIQSPNRRTDPSTGILAEPLRTASVDQVVSENVFDQLRERAVETEAVYRHAVGERWIVEDETGVLLTRIFRNCDQIKAVLSRTEVKNVVGGGIDRDHARTVTLPLESSEIVSIRKIWEIGTESVVMQTVVQLDGDIVTRIQQGREAALHKPLHELHQQAVSSALEHWQFLAKTVATFLSDALRGFFLGPRTGG